MPELVVLNKNGFKITECNDVREGEHGLILRDVNGDTCGYVRYADVGKVLRAEEHEDS